MLAAGGRHAPFNFRSTIDRVVHLADRGVITSLPSWFQYV